MNDFTIFDFEGVLRATDRPYNLVKGIIWASIYHIETTHGRFDAISNIIWSLSLVQSTLKMKELWDLW